MPAILSLPPLPTDPHSFAAASALHPVHLRLDLAVDFATRTLVGSATWQLAEPPTAPSELVLDTRDLLLDRVQLGAAEDAPAASYTLGPAADPVLGQALRIAVPAGTAQVRISYRTSPGAAALQWLEPRQTAGTHPFLFTQSQAILARTWLPCPDSPGLRFSYEATVRVLGAERGQLLALMSAADNPQATAPDGQYHFHHPRPVPAYLLALAVGRLDFAALGPSTGVYAEPASLAAAQYEFGDLSRMVAAAEQLYGAYRWGRHDLLLLPPSFPFGGMENPCLTFVTPTIVTGDRSLTSLVAHELAHSWSGNLVTNATWDDFWLNEGFTVYFERRIMEQLYGRPYADMLQVLGEADLQHTLQELGPSSADTHLRQHLAGRDPDEGLTDIAYEKGCLLLLTLEALVGRPRLDAFIKEYFARFSFQSMSTDRFAAYLNATLLTPTEANQLDLPAWLDGPGLPPGAPVARSARFTAVEETLARLAAGTPPAELQPATQQWASQEWEHFVRGLPPTLSPDTLGQLDNTFHFTATGNSEVLAAWLGRTTAAGYAPATPTLENFLRRVGRRKFVVPLYRALLATSGGAARAIYAEARPNYHAVTTSTLDALLAP